MDITHSTELAENQIFQIAKEQSNAPVTASHNGAQSTSKYPLNLSSSATQQIALSNGIIGIIFFRTGSGCRTSNSRVITIFL